MINPNWIVPPVEVANQSIGDIFLYNDLVKGILMAEVLISIDPIQFLEQIILALQGVVVSSGVVDVTATQITQKRADILLNLMNSGKPNF